MFTLFCGVESGPNSSHLGKQTLSHTQTRTHARTHARTYVGGQAEWLGANLAVGGVEGLGERHTLQHLFLVLEGAGLVDDQHTAVRVYVPVVGGWLVGWLLVAGGWLVAVG